MVGSELSYGQHEPSAEFDVDDDAFHALLATDNGKGVGRMLASYPGLFGVRLMRKVRVFTRETSPMPDLCWMPELIVPPPRPVCPSPDRPLSKKERRRRDRQSRSSNVARPASTH